jgi:tellurite resistance protein TehA-like permease
MNDLRQGVRTLNPAYFAMVMATGIVSISNFQQGMVVLAKTLVWVNVAAFAVLWLTSAMRACWYPRDMFDDLTDHQRGVGYFTAAAGACVLATQLIVVLSAYGPAEALWWAGAALWAGLSYAIFSLLTVKETKPSLADGINGGWLVAVVAMQSVANAGVLLLPRFPEHRQTVLFCCLALWLAGGMLYVWMISIIFYRYTFFKFSPADLMPPYWINMGAMAISALTGATLIGHASEWAFLERLLPSLYGFTLLFWATATWWIPMLVILGVWRHAYKRLKIAYDPLYWGAVFPIGMYATCTFRLAQVTGVEGLAPLSGVFNAAALAAWMATLAGLARSLWRTLLATPVPQAVPGDIA